MTPNCRIGRHDIKNNWFALSTLFLLAGFLAGCGKTTFTPIPQASRQPSVTAPFATLTPRPAVNAAPPEVLTGHNGAVTELSWTPDGDILASSSGNFSSTDTSIRLWTSAGKPVATLAGHTRPVMSLAWSPDGQVLASGSLDETIRLWSRSGAALKTLRGGAGSVFAVAWSPDGKTLATASIVAVLNPTVQLWDRRGNILRTLTTRFSGGKFYNLAWSPDGKYLVGGATDYKVWNAAGEEIFWLEHSAGSTPSWGMAWSPDSRLWAVGDESGFVDVLSSSGKRVARAHDTGGVNSLAWSPDGSILAGAKTLWSADGNKLASLEGQPEYVNSTAWSLNGNLLASGGSDGANQNFTRDGRANGELLGPRA